MSSPSPLFMTEPLLEVRAVRKSYDGHQVLDNVRFSIDRGEIVSLVGPSGCGKSTVLRAIAGLDREIGGEIRLAGTRLTGPSARVGVIFQEPRLLPWLTVADNVAFPAGPRRGNDPRVARLLAEVGLAEVGRALPKQLSGGMAQRVALARGLFEQPDLLLLDEPFSAVDAVTRMRLQTLLVTLASAHGTAALLVTHDLDEALYLSDRVLLLGRPRGAASGPAHIVDEFRVATPRRRERRDPGLTDLYAALLDGLNGSA